MGGAIASLNAQLVGHGFATLTPRPTRGGPTRADADAGGYNGHGYSASYDRLPLMAGYLPSSSSGMPQEEEEGGRYPAEAVRAEAAEVRVAAQEVRAAAALLWAWYTCALSLLYLLYLLYSLGARRGGDAAGGCAGAGGAE